jgi:hypothetical protein
MQNIHPDLFPYLLEHDFVNHSIPGDNTVVFSRFNTSVRIKNDTVEFVQYYDGDEHTAPDFRTFATYTGIAAMGLMDWMMLLHITRVVTIQQFVKKEQAKNPAVDLMADLFSYFQPLKTAK